MKVLVANLGSTSFKYQLIEMSDETTLARGAVDRIGSPESSCTVEIGDWKDQRTMSVPNHGVAVDACLQQLTDPQHGCIKSADEVDAIGFKAVHGGRFSGVFRIDEEVLGAMEEMREVAPAHNPPYVAAMRQLASTAGDIPLIAAFETDFHQTIPDEQRYYAIPKEWSDDFHIRRFGFHGNSHRYIAARAAELIPDASRVISCHLGGSSSLCAIRDGKSVGTTMGMSPQTGLPQNNRVGDFDPFAIPLIMEKTGLNLTEVLDKLANEGGLLGLSGKSSDMRDLEDAAAAGDARCQLALDVYVAEVRRHMGGLLALLGGADAIVFTGGIGEKGKEVRAQVCEGLEDLGIAIDRVKNDVAEGEMSVHSDTSRTQIWRIPTNEELIVARKCVELLSN